MISQLTPAATLPTRDMSRARKFYEETLGLKASRAEKEGVFYPCGDGMIFLYESDFAGTNKATAVTFATEGDKFEMEMDALRQKDVSFMTFDFEGIKWDDDVAHTEDGMKAVWFADPDGNILNLSTMPA